MIRAIVFDVGGVLVQKNVFATILDTLSKEYNVDAATLANYANPLWQKVSEGELTEMELWPNLIKYFHLSPTILPNINTQETNLLQPIAEVWQYVELLQSKYTLAILSNMGEHWANIRENKFNLSKYFSPIIWSCDLNIAKPNIKIFHYLINKLNILPEECIFIDDKEENIMAARKCGINAIHYQDPKQLRTAFYKYGVVV